MRTKMLALVAVGMIAIGGMAACTNDGNEGSSSDGGGTRGGGGTGKVGVILPDTKTSQRWGSDDPKLLKAAFDAADVPVDIQNAEGDKARFQQIAADMIAGGVKVLMIVNLDSGTGKAVLDKAKTAGVKTIDYDRLTLNGGADYYVSFNNEAVGTLQGEGLTRCLAEKKYSKPVVADLNGSPTDNNATLFKAGYDTVLQPKYDDGVFIKGPDQSVADWDNDEAKTVFREMWTQTNHKINGVLAANDGLANAAIEVLKDSKMNGKVPVTGQDATTQGLQNILAGDQCMTVYKAIRKEAEAAADLAIKLYKGEQVTAPDEVKDPESGDDVKSFLENPQAIYKDNINVVIKDGFVERKAVCAGRYEPMCRTAGITK